MKKIVLLLSCVLLSVSLSAQASTTAKLSEVLSQLEQDMVYVEGGTLMLGCTVEQGNDCDEDERPAHPVSLDSFYISKYEVTQQLWGVVMGYNPSQFEGANLPVENVSWDDVQIFITKLNAHTGKKYRLPTEAEWEYAARGGRRSKYKYAGSEDIASIAWYETNAGGKTHPVGSKLPNEIGLYDMCGNVWEWCNDRYGQYNSAFQTNPQGNHTGANRVGRGGSWNTAERRCRISYRDSDTPATRSSYLGLRLVY